MSLPRIVQLAGLLFVTYVMVESYRVSDMTFQFGGLTLGAALFVAGRWWESRTAR